MQITHLGHACLVVESADQRVLIDPGNFSTGLDAVTGLDAILVTHQHPDHADPEALPGLVSNNPRARLLAETETAAALVESTHGKVRPESLATGETVTLGDLSVHTTGDRHAFNHDWMPQVGNLGLVLRADDEPTLFHPGDAYDAEPGDVDVLALPLSAPWTAIRDTLDFNRRIAARWVVPIHDGLLSQGGRDMYLMHTRNTAPEGTEVTDLGDGRQATFGYSSQV